MKYLPYTLCKICLISVLLCLSASVQSQNYDDFPELKIVAIDGQVVGSGTSYHRHLRIQKYQHSGVDIQLEFSGMTDLEAQKFIYAFVLDEESKEGRVFNHLTASPDGWRMKGVSLGDKQLPGKYYTVQLGFLKTSLQHASYLTPDKWHAMLKGHSETIHIEILERHFFGLKSSFEEFISIEKVDELLVSHADDEILVESEVAIEGNFRTEEDSFSIYAIIHEKGIDKKRLVGPAQIKDGHWRISNAFIPKSYKPHSSDYEISAALFLTAPQAFELTDKELYEQSYMLAKEIDVSVIMNPKLHLGLSISQFLLEGDTLFLARGEKVADIDSLEAIYEIRGTYDKRSLLPQSLIYVWANPVGKPFWILLGRTSPISETAWDLQVNLPLALKGYSDSLTRFIAVSASHHFHQQIVAYDYWFTHSENRSQSVILVENSPGSIIKPHQNSRLLVKSFDGDKLNKNLIHSAFSNFIFTGEAKNIPQEAKIWGAYRLNGQDRWQIFGPAYRNKKVWELIDGKPPAEVDSSFSHIDLKVFSSLHHELESDLGTAELAAYSLTQSPTYRIKKKASFQDISFSHTPNLSSMLWIILIALLVLGLLFLLERYFSLFASFASLMSCELAKLAESFTQKTEDKFKPDSIETVLGFVILGLTLFAIGNYFPVYAYAIQSVFQLEEEKGSSLAILFIVFVGLTGILIHLNEVYGFSEEKPTAVSEAKKEEDRSDEKEQDKKNTSTQDISTYITLILILLALVQSLVYFQLYTSQAASNILPAIAMAIAAFFITVIEALSIYFSTRFLVDFLGWLFFSLLLFGLKILAGAFEIIEKALGSKRKGE